MKNYYSQSIMIFILFLFVIETFSFQIEKKIKGNSNKNIKYIKIKVFSNDKELISKSKSDMLFRKQNFTNFTDIVKDYNPDPQFLLNPSNEENDFYLELNENEIYIKKSNSTVDDNFLTIPNSNIKSKQHLGEFSEGNCLKLNLNSTFLGICFNNKNDENLIFDTLSNDIVHNYNNFYPGAEEFSESQGNSSDYEKSKYNNFNNSGIDENNYDSNQNWELVKNWSECSKECGGGIQFLKRKCIGRCEGPDTVYRECNLFDCSSVVIQEEHLSPIIKVVPISSRPQRYKECSIKEIDMDVIIDDKRIPARVIMTLDSISIENNNIKILLPQIKNTLIKNDCLEVSELMEKNKIIMCILVNHSNLSHQQRLDELKLFRNQILMFRDECKDNNNATEYSANIVEEIMNDPEVISAIKRAKEKRLKKVFKRQRLERRLQANTQQTGILKSAELMAIKAFEKELLYQQRRESEEVMREMKEIEMQDKKEKEHQIIVETHKINSKNKIDQENLVLAENLDTDKEQNSSSNSIIENIKKQVSENIVGSRNKFNEKLIKMRLEHEKEMLKQNTNVVELKTVEELPSKPFKKTNVCIDFVHLEDKRFNYCNSKVTNDADLNKKCKQEFFFCNICCKYEFGAISMNERDICYKKCDTINFQLNKNN